MSIAEQLRLAWNAHDAGRVSALFAEDYHSMSPTHPSREFVGRSQVLANWSGVFAGVPDFAAELIASSVDGQTEWTEWAWKGTHTDGEPFWMRGVAIFEVRGGLIVAARLYLEPVETSGDAIDAAVDELYRPPKAGGRAQAGD